MNHDELRARMEQHGPPEHWDGPKTTLQLLDEIDQYRDAVERQQAEIERLVRLNSRLNDQLAETRALMAALTEVRGTGLPPRAS